MAQPLLVAAAIAAAATLAGPRGEVPADVVAGHSVGELTAGVLAGVIGADDAMRLVRVRGEAMAAAAAAEPTGMTAVLGGDEETVLAAIASYGLTPANINGAGQIVAAGTLERAGGVRRRPAAWGAAAAAARWPGPSIPGTWHRRSRLSASHRRGGGQGPGNHATFQPDGAAVGTGQEWLGRIVAQVAAPVRWDLCMRTMADLGVTAMIELPPAGTLTGLARRALPGVTVAVKTPDQLDAARAMIEEHLSEPRTATRLGSPARVAADRGADPGTFRSWAGRMRPRPGGRAAGATRARRRPRRGETGHRAKPGGGHRVAGRGR